ncbi:hypothetical protein HPP92_014985 [Vanilla planifolia]|uniref:Uncharacterized protein n=1 Tax=Vanilla planifolia TaxID=51239 RepID=A0A835QKC2_VANPL|nr:hypothetical protein HPP92_014985 [Vanilla planifolia]
MPSTTAVTTGTIDFSASSRLFTPINAMATPLYAVPYAAPVPAGTIDGILESDRTKRGGKETKDRFTGEDECSDDEATESGYLVATEGLHLGFRSSPETTNENLLFAVHRQELE